MLELKKAEHYFGKYQAIWKSRGIIIFDRDKETSDIKSRDELFETGENIKKLQVTSWQEEDRIAGTYWIWQ